MTDEADARITARIKNARKQARLSQEEMAHRLGVSTRSWCRWERNEGGGWQPHLDAIAAITNVTREDLLGEDRVQPVTMDDLLARIDALTTEVANLRRELRSRQPPSGQP